MSSKSIFVILTSPGILRGTVGTVKRIYCLYVAELKSLEESHNAIEIPNEDQIASYYKIRQQLDSLSKQLLSFIQRPQYLLPFLQPGRLVKVCSQLFLV